MALKHVFPDRLEKADQELQQGSPSKDGKTSENNYWNKTINGTGTLPIDLPGLLGEISTQAVLVFCQLTFRARPLPGNT